MRPGTACKKLYFTKKWPAMVKQHVFLLVFYHVRLQIDWRTFTYAQHEVTQIFTLLHKVCLVVVILFCVDLVFLVNQISNQVTSLSDLNDKFLNEARVPVLVQIKWIWAYFKTFNKLLVNLSIQTDLQVVGQWRNDLSLYLTVSVHLFFGDLLHMGPY